MTGTLRPQERGRVVTTCPTCAVDYEPTLREDPGPGGGVKVYVSCPMSHRIEVAYLPPRAVELQEELAALRRLLPLGGASDMRRRMARLEAEYRRLVVRLDGNTAKG